MDNIEEQIDSLSSSEVIKLQLKILLRNEKRLREYQLRSEKIFAEWMNVIVDEQRSQKKYLKNISSSITFIGLVILFIIIGGICMASGSIF